MTADLIVLIHFLFVLFVVFGGALALRWPRVMWLHIPAAVWGVLIEFTGWVCPLTPLEIRLRGERGEPAYEGDFIAHYVLPILYPEGLTRRNQVVLGTLALAINLSIYSLIMLRGRRSIANDI